MTWTAYLSSGLSSCLGGGVGGFEFCLKLFPSTTEIGCGISSPDLYQPLFVVIWVGFYSPQASRCLTICSVVALG